MTTEHMSDHVDVVGEKVVPETAISKEDTEINRSEMVDREEVKVNFPQLKLHPTMSKTVTQGPFAKITHIDEESLDHSEKRKNAVQAMNNTHQNLVSPPEEMLKSFSSKKSSFDTRGSRHMALAAPVMDLTHDVAPEHTWKPIKKAWDKLPPQPVMDDKIFLREWEHDLQNEYFSKIFDRRTYDIDVFKKFAVQGEIIKMQIDARELTRDTGFWETEKEI